MTGNHLKSVRKFLKLNQRDFATKIGIKQSYYSELESGRKEISDKFIEKLHQSVGLSSNEIEQLKSDNIAIKNVGDAVGVIKNKAQTMRSFEPYLFYDSLTESDLDFELSIEIESLKDIYTDWKLLREILHNINPPKSLSDKFPLLPDFKEYLEAGESEFEERHAHLKDKRRFKILKIVDLYQEDVLHIRRMMSKLIAYMHRYSEMKLLANYKGNSIE